MSRAVKAGPVCAPQTWMNLVEAAILETDPHSLLRRIQEAQDAVMDEIEDSLHSARRTEHQSLMNAMYALRELRRVSQIHGSHLEENSSTADRSR